MQLAAVLEEPKIRDLHHQFLSHSFRYRVPSLMLVAQVVYHPHLHLHPCLVHELDRLVFALTWHTGYVSLRVTRLLARLGCWLIRKTRQVQHNMSHCGVLSWRGIQTKSWRCTFVSLRIQFNSGTPIFHLRKGKQNGHIMCLKHIMVEHGGVVGNSLQVSVSELANTKDLLQRQNSVVMS